MAAPSIDHARRALANPDLRRLLAIRLLGQGGDGFFQVALLASVLAPSDRSTLVDLFLTGLVTALPFTLLGPFVGVFIDRWPRRTILRVAPLLKTVLLILVLIPPTRNAAAFYIGALAVISVNRFQLATAGAIVPRLADADDLLAANSVVTVGGSLANLVGVFIGGRIADVAGSPTPSILIAGGCWLVTSWVAARIATDLSPMALPEAGLLRHRTRRVVAELGDALRVLARTPRAIGPITTFTVDQLCQGVILTLMLVVFRDEFREGIGSVSNVIGASGVGVMAGIATVGWLERRFAKERVIALAFIVAGVLLLSVGLYLRDWSLLTAAFFLGLTFAWKKIPTDTLVQEALPDGYRGRVFALFDVSYNAARIVSGALTLVMVPALGTRGSVIAVGIVLLAWSPVLPRWLAGRPEIEVVYPPGGTGVPRAVRWGGVEEPVEVVRSWDEVRDGTPVHGLALRLLDGSLIDLHRAEPGGTWTIDRERDDPRPAHT